MSSFIQLNDVNGTTRFVNIKHIAFIEPEGDNCKIVMKLKGRDGFPHYAFLTTQNFDEVMRLIVDSDV